MKMSGELAKTNDKWKCKTCGAMFDHCPTDETVEQCSKCVEVEVLRAALAAKERECDDIEKSYLQVLKRMIGRDVANAALRKLCVEEEKQLSKIAWLADNATATHLLLICDRLKAAAEGNG